MKLDQTDLSFVLRSLALGSVLRSKLEVSTAPVELTPTEARAICEAAADRLAERGFDENYEPNLEGRFLEALIDRLNPL